MNLTRLAMYKKMFGGSGSSGGSSGGSSSGGKPNVKEKDVNFYDYDGTLLHSYTVEEAQDLSELPELPTQKGLICQGWNYDLDTIKAHNRALNIGATYITDDGKTRLYIKIAAEGRMDVPLYFQQTVANGVTIDWGDGSATQILSGTGNKNATHTYASIGEYVITLDVAEGCTLELGNSYYGILGYPTSNDKFVYRNMLKKVEIGVRTTLGYYGVSSCNSLSSITIPNGVTSISAQAFHSCYSLASIVIPNGATSIGSQTFRYCYTLGSIIIPNSATSIGNAPTFGACYSLASIVIPNSVTSIGNETFYDCKALASIVIPNGVTYIGSGAFSNCYCMKFYDFTKHTSVPTLGSTSVFNGIPSDCEIRVPAALYDEWIAATNWSTYASKIVGV